MSNPLQDAWGFFSGGCCYPDINHSMWRTLTQRLQQFDVDPNEYAYWLVYIRQPVEGTPISYDASVLGMRNYVCSPLTFAQFMSWRDDHDQRATITKDSQLAYLQNRVKSGTPVEQVLADPVEPVGAIMRCEAALLFLTEPDKDIIRQKILDTFSPMAGFTLAGAPIYRTLCPLFVEYKKTH